MIVINQAKAIEVTKGKIRAWRDGEFKKNDIAIQNALVDGSDTAEDTAASCWQQVCSRPPSPILHARTDSQGYPYVAECPQRHSRS